MHKINVLVFGSKNFNTSLEELKDHLNFKLTTFNEGLKDTSLNNYDILFFHQDYLKINSIQETLGNTNKIKILAFNSKEISKSNFSESISLPFRIEDLNNIIENSIIKKSFNENSSIRIKNYVLDKNEKKLLKNDNFISLTEKEIQLLELFLNNIKPVGKDEILEKVWKYSSSADTHTVETHIYRLRKKIKSEFQDENFILNNKDGYLL
tara:strand:+ start:325 stop:951 length:627 start_codon:yes stop_codon:yes gene_type:complete